MTDRGLRVLAVARGPAVTPEDMSTSEGLELLGVVGLIDPPRPEAAEAVSACRRAHIRLAVVTGDHPGTALAVARAIGLSDGHGPVLTGDQLPDDDDALGALVDHDGAVIARVSPEQKLRVAQALQRRGHVLAMTGDGVNDAPALRTADIGIAMGATGSDVAREAADLILLDDNFATIVRAVELGRATFANIRRFLTYHLTDNVAELAPFVAWALTGGAFPLAIGVLQVLALDIGTDMLPALALGAEPPNRRTLDGPARTGQLIDRRVVGRAFGVLGPVEALAALGAFLAVLLAGGWRWGDAAPATLMTAASGTAFAAIVLGQLANAYACRSESQPFFRRPIRDNRLLLLAVGVEVALLLGFVGFEPLARVLGGSWPGPAGWGLAAAAGIAVLIADTVHKGLIHRSTRKQGRQDRLVVVPGQVAHHHDADAAPRIEPHDVPEPAPTAEVLDERLPASRRPVPPEPDGRVGHPADQATVRGSGHVEAVVRDQPPLATGDDPGRQGQAQQGGQAPGQRLVPGRRGNVADVPEARPPHAQWGQ
jgi:magnesium-transporting ATPase (P-type)